MRKNRLTVAATRKALSGRFDERQAYILTSTPRSGSTLLGQAIGAIDGSCMLFEPLHLDRVPEAREAGFSWRTYVDPDASWPEGEQFLRDVFTGRVINSWTSRQMSVRDALRSKMLIVKFVRANRMLPWICNTFDVPAPVLLVRHPCAVIASQMRFGWSDVRPPRIPKYLAGFPGFRKVFAGLTSQVELRAASWATDLLPALLQPAPHPWLTVSYEDLVEQPRPTLSRIFEAWAVPADLDRAVNLVGRPSAVVSKSGISGVDGWRDQLTAEQSAQIIDTVHALGLTFYGLERVADSRRMSAEQLREDILRAGVG